MKSIFVETKQILSLEEKYVDLIEVSFILDVDNTILDSINIKCYSDKVNLDSVCDINGNYMSQTEGEIYQWEAVEKITQCLDKYLDKSNPEDKFHFVGFNSELYTMIDMNKFFIKYGNYDFDTYFWKPSLDLSVISRFMLSGAKDFPLSMNLMDVMQYFGFKIEPEYMNDTYYIVNLIRSLYYILEKFKSSVVYFQKAQIN